MKGENELRSTNARGKVDATFTYIPLSLDSCNTTDASQALFKFHASCGVIVWSGRLGNRENPWKWLEQQQGCNGASTLMDGQSFVP